ncbi:hypothetical protein BKA61DRAFT_680673 [Leptodontidium sp. MPI-SDFR-AT-0119]|nr:hypothetical protein BKA61DRAFT_680673 [Leptodontidium sp. MPI-SDFR-AT-0119]
MSNLEWPGGSSKQYRDIHINADAKAQLGDIYHQDTYHINRKDPLNLLPFANNAPFNSFDRQHEPACLPNTRVELLQEIYNWADGKYGQDERCIFWLNGLAGTGKSTISRTVAHRYNEQKRLGASFFFSKGGGDVSYAAKFFTSLAVQLAFSVPSLRQYICEQLESGSGSHRSYIIVVDALDECENDKDVRTILQLLAEARSLTTARLRVFLTSRPEVPIRHSIRLIPQAEHEDFILQNIPLAIVNHDIFLFLEYNLGTIGREWSLGANWPGEVVLRQLILYACGLFIWAATACRFIREGRQFARRRLDTPENSKLGVSLAPVNVTMSFFRLLYPLVILLDSDDGGELCCGVNDAVH